MTAIKQIQMIVTPPPAHYVGDGFRVHQIIPGAIARTQERMDPFLMLDYNAPYYFSPSEVSRGVGAHPHKWFETVTIAYKGRVAHHDSYGNNGVIKEWDIQWMTAGAGILHKEYHEEWFSKEGGEFHMVQLWINLPQKNKETQPWYQTIRHADIPVYVLPDHAGMIEIIAWSYKDMNGIATTFSPINLFNAKLQKWWSAQFSSPSHYNTGLLIVQWSITLQNQSAEHSQFVLFENTGEEFTITATQDDTIVLVMSGEPLNEPIVSYGPFVMNSEADINRAIQEYQQWKFGNLT